MPLKILYVGTVQGLTNIGKYYLFPQRIVNGFSRLGHNVYLFNDREIARANNMFNSSRFGAKRMNIDLIRTCKSFAPDVVVLGHCWNVTNETLAEIRAMLPDLKIIYRNVDALDAERTRMRIKERSPMVDAIFSTTAGEVLRDLASPNNFSSFFPNPTDSSIDTGKAHEIENPQTDLFYAAAPMRSENEDHRAAFMRDVLQRIEPQVKTNIAGSGINEKTLFGHEYMDALAVSGMGLSLNKFDNLYLYASDRMTQYMGNGLLTFCHKGPRHSDLFADGEIVEFEAAEDLAEQILYFKKNPKERMERARNGYEKSRKMFACERVAQYMLDLTFGQAQSFEYEWPTTQYKV